jgi:hypothetical protein
MAIHYTRQYYSSTGSISPNIPVSWKSRAPVYNGISVRIDEGFSVSHPRLMRTAKVMYPFDVNIQRAEEGFVATSSISDVYELGETPKQAILNYLYALVDEIMWFEDNKESMSEPMLRNFSKLQFYLGLV